MRNILIAAFLLLTLAACNHHKSNNRPSASSAIDYSAVAIPQFNADSALSFVAAQLDFGFRIPSTPSHSSCAAYLRNTMGRFCDTAFIQEFSTTLWTGQTVKGKNIIASLNPEAETRVLLAAHWDSRMWADHDPDAANHHSPIMGANDGASGVGALIEMARVMSTMPPSVGVDFIFFDVEDQGIAEWADKYEDNTWCKGSQYWAQYPHRPYYRAVYGVLFDMVGTDKPRFTKEEVSRNFAPGITSKIWRAAAALGHGSIFVDQNTDAILDDHLYVNQMAHFPMVDIVQNSTDCSFVSYWHTLEDTLDKINPNTLRIVAQVTMATIYGDYPHQQ